MGRGKSNVWVRMTVAAVVAAGSWAGLPPGPSAGTATAGASRADTKEPKSLVVGIDGATWSRLSAARTPVLSALRRQGLTAATSLYAEPMAPTLSGPGWATISTGVWPDKHRVRDNELDGLRRDRFPDYLTRLEQARAATRTLAVGTWEPITSRVFGPAVDRRVHGETDAQTTDVAVAALRDGDPDSTFVHLDDVDHAGHDHGATSPEYGEALRQADTRLGRLVAAVRARPTFERESWLVVVTADHGHTDAGGHGGNSPAERSSFVVARGPGLKPGTVRRDVRVVDVATSVLAHHGVALRPQWGLDGRPLRSLRTDAFDRVRPGQVPRGWSVDNRRMPAGGVREWRGWTVTDEASWTATDRGQGRETAVRTRGLFAVADSDEWDDSAHGAGPFDSTLRTPWYAVRGARRAVLRYATTYRVDGPQSAVVTVAFDRGATRTVRRYTADADRFERLMLRVPPRARALQVRFRYTGVNSAFWALDQVVVTPRRAGTGTR